jgi:hypothetical protein
MALPDNRRKSGGPIAAKRCAYARLSAKLHVRRHYDDRVFLYPSALASMHFRTPQRKQDDGSPGVLILPPIGCCALTRGLSSRAVFGAFQECFGPGAKAEGKIKGRPLL